MKKQFENKTTLWTSAKIPTDADHQVALALLSLRQEYDAELADKKIIKNDIWKKIAVKMNSMEFFVGDGTDGRENCRQKLANMQSAYVCHRWSLSFSGNDPNVKIFA